MGEAALDRLVGHRSASAVVKIQHLASRAAVVVVFTLIISFGMTGPFSPVAPSASAAPAFGTSVAATTHEDLGPEQELKPGQRLVYGPHYTMIMQGDGNLVVYKATGFGPVAVWSTGTYGHPGARAVMQRDGNFVVFDASGVPLWATGTAGRPGSCLMGGSSLGTTVVDTPGLGPAWFYYFGHIEWPLWAVSPCYAGDQTGPKIAIVGDSITYNGVQEGALDKVLGPRYAYQASGMVGYEFDQQLPALRAMITDPAGAPQDVIINLGTNDSIKGNTQWAAGFENLAKAVGNRCTLLVTVTPTANRAGNLADRINAGERAWASSHPNFHIVPWDTVASQDNYGWLEPDLIHPTPAGERYLARLYAGFLRTDCGS